jgi:hypothetical protein
MGLPKEKKKFKENNLAERLEAVKDTSIVDTKEKPSSEPAKQANKKKPARPSTQKEETTGLFVKIPQSTMSEFLLAFAQEQIKWKAEKKTLTKGKFVDLALKEYFKKLKN